VNQLEEQLRHSLQTVTPTFEPASLDTISARVRRRRRILGAGTAVFVALLVGAAVTVPRPGPSGSGDGQAGAGSVDALQYQGVTYARWAELTSPPAGVRQITDDDVGPEVGRVTGSRADEPVERGPSLGELEATALAPDTPVYAVKGYPTSFRLAARRDGQLGLYEPWENTNARVGADLLALKGRVLRIGIYQRDTLDLLGDIKQSAQVSRLVDTVLRAPVALQEPTGAQDLYILTFHLTDGTGVTRMFDSISGYLEGGVLTPQEFATAIRRAADG